VAERVGFEFDPRVLMRAPQDGQGVVVPVVPVVPPSLDSKAQELVVLVGPPASGSVKLT
jgi:hypothetical protein